MPELYDTVLVPMMFLDYAEDVAAAVVAAQPTEVLEIAAGTGAVTRALHRLLPAAQITATDLNPPMLDSAAEMLPASELVRWRVADAPGPPLRGRRLRRGPVPVRRHVLPRPPGRLRRGAPRPAPRRAIRPRQLGADRGQRRGPRRGGGIGRAPARRSTPVPAADPLRVHRLGVDQAGTRGRGFTSVDARRVEHRNRPTSAHDIAVAHCQGTPIANVLAERQVDSAHATAEVARLLEDRLGPEPFSGRLSASIVSAARA